MTTQTYTLNQGQNRTFERSDYYDNRALRYGVHEKIKIIGNTGNETVKLNGHNENYGDYIEDIHISMGAGNDIVDINLYNYGFMGANISSYNTLIYGEAGDDTIKIRNYRGSKLLDKEILSHDTVYGGLGNDIIHTGNGDDYLYGDYDYTVMTDFRPTRYSVGFDDDYLDGGSGNDYLDGGIGNDELHGGSGNDYIYGGAGDDILVGGEGSDYLDGGSGTDVIYAHKDWTKNEIETVYGGSDGDIIIVGVDATSTSAGESVDWGKWATGKGSELAVTTIMELAVDMLSLGGPPKIFLGFAAKAGGHAIHMALNGTKDAQPVVEKNLDAEVHFKDFDAREDLIVIPINAEWMSNYSANVTDVVNNSSLVLSIGSTDFLRVWVDDGLSSGMLKSALINSLFVFKDADGIVTVQTHTGVTIDSDDLNLATDELANNSGQWLFGAYGDSVLTGADNNTDNTFINEIHGSNFNNIIYVGDVIVAKDEMVDGVKVHNNNALYVLNSFLRNSAATAWGYDGDDIIFGALGDDILRGGNGNDVLQGFQGRDELDGGEGNDTASYATIWSEKLTSPGTYELAAVENDGKGVTVDLNKIIQVSEGQANGDTLTSIENVIGSDWDDLITGDENDNILNGGKGNDTLIGGGGADTIIGGAGEDILSGGTGTDTFVFYAGRENGDKTILDYQIGVDNIKFESVNPWNISNLLVEQSGRDTVVTFRTRGSDDSTPGNNSAGPLYENKIVFKNVDADQLRQTIETGGRDWELNRYTNWDEDPGEGGVHRTITTEELLGSAINDEANNQSIANLQVASGSGVLKDMGDGTWVFTRTGPGREEVMFTYNVNDGEDQWAAVATLHIFQMVDAPFVDEPYSDQTINEDAIINLGYPRSMFQGERLEVTATLADGSPLPDWLDFHWKSKSSSFEGKPPDDFNGTLSIKVTATDPIGRSASHQFDLEIVPVNDDAIITGDDSGAVTEDSGAPATGDLNHTDVDSNDQNDRWNTTVVQQGAYGTLVLADDGTWKYQLNDADPTVDALNANNPLKDKVTVATMDGTPKEISINITGASDDAVFTGDDSGAVTEDSGVPATGDLNYTDADGNNQNDRWNTTVVQQGAFGTLTITGDGTWTYQLDDAHDIINGMPGRIDKTKTLPDKVVVATMDGTQKVITIYITGTNDAAVITGDDSDTVTENSGAPATGDLNYTDVDGIDADDRWNTTVVQQGAYGTLVLAGDGTWKYQLNDANPTVDALNVNDSLKDKVTVAARDGTPKEITINITGANDYAIITGDDSGAVTENSGVPATGDLNHTDVDGNNQNDRWNTTVVQQGAFGTLKLEGDGTWKYQLNDADPTVDALNANNPLKDKVTVATMDGTPKEITINITGANDNLIILGTLNGEELHGGSGNDIIEGLGGNDTISGGRGNDFLRGGKGDDILNGDDGNDHLYGQQNDDILDGGLGRDVLYGGTGSDTMTGGGLDLERDLFVMETAGGTDTITDFEDGVDMVQFGAIAGTRNFDSLSITNDINGNAVVTYSEGTITFLGIDQSDLTASDFMF